MFVQHSSFSCPRQQRKAVGRERERKIRSSQPAATVSLQDTMIMHGRRTAAMALVCLLCLLIMAPLLAQGAQPSRKLLSTAQDKPISHGDPGSHAGGDGAATTPEPCSEARGGSRGNAGTGEVQYDTAKWAEIHTDYIYTQDDKHP